MTTPEYWMKLAHEEVGQAERPGKDHNKRILEYGKKLGLSWYDKDETPWCALFVGWVLETAGIKSTRSAAARSYEKWGERLKQPVPGCIAVLNRPGGASWMGHVGFFLEERGERICLLGGNQNDKVSLAWFNKDRVVAYVWPKGVPIPVVAPPAPVRRPRTRVTPVDTGEETNDR